MIELAFTAILIDVNAASTAMAMSLRELAADSGTQDRTRNGRSNTPRIHVPPIVATRVASALIARDIPTLVASRVTPLTACIVAPSCQGIANDTTDNTANNRCSIPAVTLTTADAPWAALTMWLAHHNVPVYRAHVDNAAKSTVMVSAVSMTVVSIMRMDCR